MRTTSSTLIALLFSSFLMACGGGDDSSDGGDAEPFDTYQDCFDDHHGEEGLSIQQAITVCCADHPIGSAGAGVVCGDTAADCEDYVDANLDTADATATDITTACQAYIDATS